LEFRYTTLNLQVPENSRFKHQLEGIDSDWVEAGGSRTAHYNNVYPGAYRFRVLACNKDGVWNLTGASLAIVLRPHVWQTWWWQGLAAFLVVGGATGAALYVARRRMRRKLELFEQRVAIEKERGRIAKDIHDDLGSSLTRIMMLGERAEEDLGRRENLAVHVGKIVSTARRTVQPWTKSCGRSTRKTTRSKGWSNTSATMRMSSLRTPAWAAGWRYRRRCRRSCCRRKCGTICFSS